MPGTAVGRDITEGPTWTFAHPEAQKKKLHFKGQLEYKLREPIY